MNRHLKCPREKNEKMLKCDDESAFGMPAWKKWKNAQMRWWSVEKMERCSNVMMHRHLKCQRRKSENILKCDHESPLDMPAWKKWKNTRMWGWISRAYRMAIHHHIWAFCIFSTRAFQIAIHHHIWAFLRFFHTGILNGDSSSHLSIFSTFLRGHFEMAIHHYIWAFFHFFHAGSLNINIHSCSKA